MHLQSIYIIIIVTYYLLSM